jgi:hypothetical protein
MLSTAVVVRSVMRAVMVVVLVAVDLVVALAVSTFVVEVVRVRILDGSVRVHPV